MKYFFDCPINPAIPLLGLIILGQSAYIWIAGDEDGKQTAALLLYLTLFAAGFFYSFGKKAEIEELENLLKRK